MTRDPLEEGGGPNLRGFVKNNAPSAADLLGLVQFEYINDASIEQQTPDRNELADRSRGFNSKVTLKVNLGYGECSRTSGTVGPAHIPLDTQAKVSWEETSTDRWTPQRSRNAGASPNQPFQIVGSSLWVRDAATNTWKDRPFTRTGSTTNTSFSAMVIDKPHFPYSWKMAPPEESVVIRIEVSSSGMASAEGRKKTVGFLIVYKAVKTSPLSPFQSGKLVPQVGVSNKPGINVQWGFLRYDPSSERPGPGQVPLRTRGFEPKDFP